MILPDATLLVYAYNAGSRHHQQAKNWLEDLVRRQVTILLPWIVPLSFMRLMTHRSVLEEPMDSLDCYALINELYELECVRQIDLGARGRAIFADYVTLVRPVGSLYYDTYLAALAVEHNAVLHTNDNDFGRFPKVRVLNPLA